ncbi:hypothetical protein [Arthrobacter sp. UYCu712]|uniref:hypothetical protein n=1 Tax=Arthrobacter sp. UYCu712 TaxID=3156340 RepID=UPI00339A3815
MSDFPSRTVRPLRRAGFPPAPFWKSLGLHLLIPFFLAAGMGLAYLGAFAQPEPDHLQVAVVGAAPQSQVFAQALNDKALGKLDVRTVADAASARSLIADREIAAAYEAGPEGATLYVASAASDTTASVVQKIFLPIAYGEHLPLKVEDVVTPGGHDPTAQGLFFLLVALSVGGYSCAIAISVVAARVGVLWRMAISVLSAAVIAGIGVTVAGPVYSVIDHNEWGIWLLAWLYDLAIILIGVGLHPVLRQWTTPTLTLLFVMLNFTSSGGIFTADLVPPFFAGLSTFWNGSAWLHAAQTLSYFPGLDFWTDGLKLGLWAAAGALLVMLTHQWSVRRTRLADELARVREEEEGVAA